MRRSHPRCRGGLARAGADLANVVPIGWSLHIFRPEGPGLALDGTGGIDRAAGVLVPEDAIAAGLLDQAVAVAHSPDELRGKLLDRLAAKFGQPIDLVG